MQDQLWTHFENQITKIITEIDNIKTKQESNNEYMMGYTTCYNLLTTKRQDNYTEKMYNYYHTVLRNYAIKIRSNLQNIQDLNFIIKFDEDYQKYILISKKIKDIMSRLEREWIPQHSKKSFDIVSKNIFKNYVYEPILEVKEIFKILNNSPVDLYLKMNKIICDMNIKQEDIINESYTIEI
jgi:tRNA nucleotidyltransferase/poly(A) polymerase